jgi:hypothetical protein
MFLSDRTTSRGQSTASCTYRSVQQISQSPQKMPWSTLIDQGVPNGQSATGARLIFRAHGLNARAPSWSAHVPSPHAHERCGGRPSHGVQLLHGGLSLRARGALPLSYVRRVPLESPLWFVVYYTATVRPSSITQRQPRVKIRRKITPAGLPKHANTWHESRRRAFVPHL